jgi:F-type H+-transporting ATPase subunit epsilon
MMELEIITPDKKLFEGEARSITLPGVDGSFQILNRHAPMVASLKKGIVRVDTAGSIKQFDINGGVVECSGNKVVVLA